jgi:hypothetical protein
MALSKQQWQFNTLGNYKPKYQVQISDTGEDIVTITHVVHTIKMGDVDEPDIMVRELIYEWQQTDAGKWIMDNSNPKPSWHHFNDLYNYSYIYQIKAYLTHKQLVYYKLKYE